MKKTYSNIIVIGGGLIGAATALSLSSLGFKITLIEKNPEYNTKKIHNDKRTVAISEGTKLFLTKLGIWKKLNSFSEPIKNIKIIDRSISNVLDFDNLRRKSNLGYIVKNKKILDVLYNHILKENNIEVINDVLLNEIQYFGDNISAKTNKGIFVSDLIIAADGKFGSSRNLLKTNFYKKKYNRKALVLNISHSKNHNSTAYEFFYKNGPLAILPMKSENKKNLSSIVWTNTYELVESLSNSDEVNLIQILNKITCGCVGQIKAINNKQQFPLSAHLNSKFYEKRFIYIGDSAHSFHPIAGQGWNLGMKDIETLYELAKQHKLLGADIGNNSFCKDYHDNTFFRAYRLYQITDKLDSVFQNNASISNFIRYFGINLIQKNKKIKNLISDFAMGIN